MGKARAAPPVYEVTVCDDVIGAEAVMQYVVRFRPRVMRWQGRLLLVIQTTHYHNVSWYMDSRDFRSRGNQHRLQLMTYSPNLKGRQSRLTKINKPNHILQWQAIPLPPAPPDSTASTSIVGLKM